MTPIGTQVRQHSAVIDVTMYTTTLILVLSLLILAESAPSERHLDTPVYLAKRSPQNIKGHFPGVKGHASPPHVALRKGEYICGNRVCSLKPGEIPAGCNGRCQYKLK